MQSGGDWERHMFNSEQNYPDVEEEDKEYVPALSEYFAYQLVHPLHCFKIKSLKFLYRIFCRYEYIEKSFCEWFCN